MNLLLLLSALLSALTGVAGGARAVEPPPAAERVVASPVIVRVSVAALPPVSVAPARTQARRDRVILPPQPAPSAPFYLQRRRE